MKKLVAIFVVIVLALSLAAPALASNTGEIIGDTTVENVVLEITVPTNLPLALDPLATKGTTQVVQTPINLINRTEEAKVLTAFYLDAELADGVTFVAAATLDATRFNIDKDAKNIHLGVMAAKAISSAGVPDFTDGVTVPFAGTTDISVQYGFIIDAQTPEVTGTNPEPAVPGRDAFTFFGLMEAYADWQADDVTVTGVYLLRAISTQTVVTTVDDTVGLVTAGLPARPVVAPEDYTFTASITGRAITITSTGKEVTFPALTPNTNYQIRRTQASLAEEFADTWFNPTEISGTGNSRIVTPAAGWDSGWFRAQIRFISGDDTITITLSRTSLTATTIAVDSVVVS